MACINMFNPDQHQSLMSPRISFSNDFVLDPPPPSAPRHDRPSDPDFEFSVGSRPMMAADELFFKGRMVPLRKDSNNNSSSSQLQKVTLRDELRSQDEESRGWEAARPPKGSSSIRWKELLGLKKSHCGGVKKIIDRELVEGSGAKNSQEPSGDGGARARDTHMGF